MTQSSQPPERGSEPLAAEHAVFGDYCALEHPLWFAPSAAEAVDEVSFRRSNAHPHVAAECAAVRDGVGLLEISNYGKFEVTGAGGAAGAGAGAPWGRPCPFRARAGREVATDWR